MNDNGSSMPSQLVSPADRVTPSSVVASRPPRPKMVEQVVAADQVGVGQHQAELLAAIAGDQVLVTGVGDHHRGHRAQHRVTGHVAVAVVEVLEVVEVDHGERERRVGPEGVDISISMRSIRLRRLASPVSGSVRLSVWRPFMKLARLVTRRKAAASRSAASVAGGRSVVSVSESVR